MQKENSFIEYKQFNVIFGLNRLTIFFPQTMDNLHNKTILKFYSTIDDGKWHCWEKRKKNYNFGDNKAKKKAEKQKSRQSRKYKKRSREYYKNFSEDEKISKRSYGNNRNKNITDAGKKKRKKYIEN